MLAGSPAFVSINERASMMSAIENAAYAVVHATRLQSIVTGSRE